MAISMHTRSVSFCCGATMARAQLAVDRPIMPHAVFGSIGPKFHRRVQAESQIIRANSSIGILT